MMLSALHTVQVTADCILLINPSNLWKKVIHQYSIIFLFPLENFICPVKVKATDHNICILFCCLYFLIIVIRSMRTGEGTTWWEDCFLNISVFIGHSSHNRQQDHQNIGPHRISSQVTSAVLPLVRLCTQKNHPVNVNKEVVFTHRSKITYA